MNKLISILGLSAVLAMPVCAQNAGTHVWRSLPLLSGYNVVIPSNGIVGPAVLPQSGVTATVVSTNVLFTKYNGQIVYSYSNNVNGGLGTNGFISDAFQPVSLVADANGDINANTTLWLIMGNTNYLPVVATNSQGQFVIPTVSTNGLFPYLAGPNPTIWPLGINSGPSWLGLGTTNFYQGFPVVSGSSITNQLFVNLYASPGNKIQGGLGSDLSPTIPMYASAPVFSCVFTPSGNGSTVQIFSTNIPTAALQGMRDVALTVGTVNSTYVVGTNLVQLLLNQAFIQQPQ